ncbi:MAG: hypothetical protein EA359_11015 [Balneolaceae bacterium]|nr:MAG: hypothetical protein EA359_11015 [Balneolaceae bacterium]
MLETTRHNYRLITIFISMIAAGLPLWTSDIRQLDFNSINFLVLWVFIGIAASFIVQFVVNLKPRDIIGSFAIGYVSAVVLHFVGTIMVSSYVQARFEISLLLALLAGISSGWIGSALWSSVKRKRPKKK